MFTVSRRTLATSFSLLFVLSLILIPGFAGKRSSVNIPGSITMAQNQRSYDEFIVGAYGAVGLFPSCFERQAEYDALTNAAAAGALRQEAERFVSTLFETQASFNNTSLTAYCQTSSYEARNPAGCDTFVGTRSGDFITDLYGAFLQRAPDQGGFTDWMNTIQSTNPPHGRKEVLNGFKNSTEFGIVVSLLYQGDQPCPDPDPTPTPCDDSNGGFGRLC